MAPSPTPTTVAICGAEAPLGQRIVRRLATDPSVLTRVVQLRAAGGAGPDELAGAGALVVVAPGAGPLVDATGGPDVDVSGVRELLARAGRAGVGSLVVVSSALVYGPWANNPVPLTEDAPLRPEPTFPVAVARAEVERLAVEWRLAHPGAPVAVLRPAVVVDRDQPGWFEGSPWAGRRPPVVRGGPPRQFVDLDDLADAVVLAWREGLDGPFNVAPDGWVTADQLLELSGPALPAPPLPEAVARVLSRWRRAAEPGLDPYLRHPWVVANDRLRAAGWEPATSNEEVVVGALRNRGWRALNPRARQELSLGAVVVVGLGAVVGLLVALRARARRRRR